MQHEHPDTGRHTRDMMSVNDDTRMTIWYGMTSDAPHGRGGVLSFTRTLLGIDRLTMADCSVIASHSIVPFLAIRKS